MSVKIKMSYADEREVERLLRLLSPALKGAEVKRKAGEPYNRLYITLKDKSTQN